MYTVFNTKGLIDLDVITTFGVSVKDTSNPIGKFGTGLKYATAICLREDLPVTMFLGSEQYTFWKKPKIIRGKSFDVCMMNDTVLPFTTELGSHWELWMAMRELWSNTMDEGGEMWTSEHSLFDLIPEEGETSFIIDGEVFANLLNSVEVSYQTPAITKPTEIIAVLSEEPSNYVYHNGIRVADVDLPTQMTYDLQGSVSLTEDRTMKDARWELERRIKHAAIHGKNAAFTEQVLLAKPEHFEHQLNFTYEVFTDEFIAKALGLLAIHGRVALNQSVVARLDAITKLAEGCEVSYKIKVSIPPGMEPTHIEAALYNAIKYDLGIDDFTIEGDE